jgi:transcription elongation factor SPT6
VWYQNWPRFVGFLGRISGCLSVSQGFGIQPQDVVLNFLAQHHTQFIDDQELNPIAFADQFVDPDTVKPQSPEELLTRARMLLATELGKDPLLRQEMREMFKEYAQVSVLPTEKGMVKIDEHHAYYVNLSFCFMEIR